MELHDDVAIKLLSKYDKLMVLKIFLSTSPNENRESDDFFNFERIYKQAIDKHNDIIINGEYLDAGFDLFNPCDITCSDKEITKIDLNIRCSAKVLTDSWKNYNSGYYLYPRSSIVKTPLRMSNCTGIIDSGYRNNIIAGFDNNSSSPFFVEKYTRLVQICGPALCPIYVIMVDTFEELSQETERGMGGFGSTGTGIEFFQLNNDDSSNIDFKIFKEIQNLTNSGYLYCNDGYESRSDIYDGDDVETLNNSCIVMEDIGNIPDMEDENCGGDYDDFEDDGGCDDGDSGDDGM